MPFVKGQPNPGRGRPKGAINKSTASVKEALEIVFSGLGGAGALLDWARENQSEFYHLWIRMLPKDLVVSMPTNQDIGDEVRARLDEVDGKGLGLPGEVGSGDAANVADTASPPAHQ